MSVEGQATNTKPKFLVGVTPIKELKEQFRLGSLEHSPPHDKTREIAIAQIIASPSIRMVNILPKMSFSRPPVHNVRLLVTRFLLDLKMGIFSDGFKRVRSRPAF